MPTMMTHSKEPIGPPFTDPSILLASDSERQGDSMYRALEGNGFVIHYAGDYSRLASLLSHQNFDVILLEVTGEHAVEPAVETALQVKRANATQFVGYVADPGLEASGLAGDAVFPRNIAKLPEALRRFFSPDGNGE